MPDTTGDAAQTTLYAIAPSDMLKRIEDRRKAWVKIKQRIAKNLDERKELRKEEARAYGEFLSSTGGGVQECLEDEDDDEEALAVKANEVTTANASSARRRNEIIVGAVRLLRAMPGGRVENTTLATMLGLDPHGVAGYLEKTDLIRKEYSGRVGNGKLEWVLADGGGAA